MSFELLTVDSRNAAAPARFARSLEETGFAVVTHHPVAPALLAQVYEEWRHFFTDAGKLRYERAPGGRSGYFPFGSEHAKDRTQRDLKEFYQVYRDDPLPRGLSGATLDLFAELSDYAARLLGWIEAEAPEAVRAGFSMPLAKMIEDSDSTMLRILHYPPLSGGEGAGEERAAAHEDINLLTLLVAATDSGLEVKDAGGRWHSVAADPGAIIVNSGDMLQECSGGFYRATTHRVVNPQGPAAARARYSMPLFLHPRREVRLSARLTAGEFLDRRLHEIGLKT